jgi:uracil-DNA glycosylase
MLKLERSWHDLLKNEIAKPYIRNLKDFLAQEKAGGQVIYPPEPLVFHAFSRTPFEKVKVVIVGQDPYHGPGQAHGLSFSVPCGINAPPSLKNIFRELAEDLGMAVPCSGCLESWAEQGVLLLNATLTVRAGQPQSHAGKGWEEFTDAVIAELAARDKPLVFLLWGRLAQEKCAKILTMAQERHLVLTAAHPSPYSAAQGFFGCRHFSKTNDALRRWGESPINWSLPS